MDQVPVKISVAGIHNEGYTAAVFSSKLGDLSSFAVRGFSDSLATKSSIDMLASDYGGRMGYRSTQKYHLANSNLVVFFVEATEAAMSQAKTQLSTFVNDRMVRSRARKLGQQPLLVLAQRALTGAALSQEQLEEKLNLAVVAGGRPFRVQVVPRPDIQTSIASEPTRATSSLVDLPEESQKALADGLAWAQATLSTIFMAQAEQASADASLDNPAKLLPQQPQQLQYDQQDYFLQQPQYPPYSYQQPQYVPQPQYPEQPQYLQQLPQEIPQPKAKVINRKEKSWYSLLTMQNASPSQSQQF